VKDAPYVLKLSETEGGRVELADLLTSTFRSYRIHCKIWIRACVLRAVFQKRVKLIF
jgi:hypothetical protein